MRRSIMIQIRNVNKSFEKKHILNQLNLEVKQGRIFGLIGINGAGKSTLLRLIAGVFIPDSGDIIVDGKSVNTFLEIKKEIFFLPDNPPYSLFSTLQQMKKIYQVFYNFNEKIFYEILKMFQLSETAQLSKLSKGMRRQGYIALAFASNAKYILFDEVFDGLDPQARLRFNEYMKHNLREDQTIILTSHSLKELEDICDDFGMLDGGNFSQHTGVASAKEEKKKFQLVVKDMTKAYLKETDLICYKKEDNRVVTIIFSSMNGTIDQYLIPGNIYVVDELPITFEEYFIMNQRDR